MNAPRSRYPRMVGLTPQRRTGSSDRWFELLVTGKDGVGGLAKLAAVPAQHGVNLAPSGGYYLVADDAFVWTTFMNFTGSKSPLERVVKEIKRLDFVSSVETVEVKGAALDEFLFPVVVGDGHRGIIMSLSPLLKAEQRLTEMLGSSGAALMFEEGKAYATESLAQLRGLMPESEPARILDDVAAWLRTTGWGLFAFDTTRFNGEGVIEVLIKEPPNVLIQGKRESHFVNGVVAGLIEAIYDGKASLTQSVYEEASRSVLLTFRVLSR